MPTTTQKETEAKLATPPQVSQMLAQLATGELTFSQANCILASGILKDARVIDWSKTQWKDGERDSLYLAMGAQPYSVKGLPELKLPPRPYSLAQFRNHLGMGKVVLDVPPKHEPLLEDLASRDILTGDMSSFSLIGLKRYMPQEILLSFLQRDHYQPASIGELLWLVASQREFLSRDKIWSIGSSASPYSRQMYPHLEVRDPNEDHCRLDLREYSVGNIIRPGSQILVKDIV